MLFRSLVHAAEGLLEKSMSALVSLEFVVVVLMPAMLLTAVVFHGCCCCSSDLWNSEILLPSTSRWMFSSHWVVAIVLFQTVVSSRTLSATAFLAAFAPTRVLHCNGRLVSC